MHKADPRIITTHAIAADTFRPYRSAVTAWHAEPKRPPMKYNAKTADVRAVAFGAVSNPIAAMNDGCASVVPITALEKP